MNYSLFLQGSTLNPSDYLAPEDTDLLCNILGWPWQGSYSLKCGSRSPGCPVGAVPVHSSCAPYPQSWGHPRSHSSANKQVVGKINTAQGMWNFPKSLLKKTSQHMLYHLYTHKPNAFQGLSFILFAFFRAWSESPEKNVAEHRERDILI